MVVLGLPCCSGFSLLAASGSVSLVVVCGLLIAGASRCRAQAVGCSGFTSCSSQAQQLCCTGPHCALLLCDTWDLPGLEIKPMSPALAGGFFTIEPPGKPHVCFLKPTSLQLITTATGNNDYCDV